MADSYSISIGSTFNRLTYLGEDRKSRQGTVGLFQCACGTQKLLLISRVRRGLPKSCGCLTAEVARKMMLKHGRSQDGAGSAYSTWEGLFQRCYNPKSPSYPEYGGRGIKVCERWHSFENFLADMGDRPTGKTLDRFPDNNGSYEPGNCRWATQTEQLLNTRRTVHAEYDGKTVTTVDLARASGVHIDKIRCRLGNGMPVERATLDTNLSERVIEHNGFSMSIAQWERHLGLNRATIGTRLKRGDSIARALRPVQTRHRKK